MSRQQWKTDQSGTNSNSYQSSEQEYQKYMRKSLSQRQQIQKYISPIKQYSQQAQIQFKKKAFQEECINDRQPLPSSRKANNYPIRKNLQIDKNCSGTKYQTENHSLIYQKEVEPSFSKESFRIADDFGVNVFSPIKQMQRTHKNQIQQSSRSSYYINGRKNSSKVNKKLFKLIQQLHQVKFMKERIASKISQFKNKFYDQIVQIKKVLFRLGIKLQRDVIELSKNQNRLNRASQLSNQARSDKSKSSQQSEQKHIKQIEKLINLNVKLQQDKIQLKQRFQTTLHSYQDQFQKMGQILTEKIQQSKNKQQCQKCLQNKRSQNMEGYQIQIWKNRLKQQQEKHARAMKNLQEKVLMLQQQFINLQQNKNMSQQKLKNKQREIAYRQSQMQLKFRQIQQKQRDLIVVQRLLEKQRDQIRKKQERISDLQFRTMREQRKIKEKQKQKEVMSSQYFTQNQKRRILSKGQYNIETQRQRSNSRSSRSSKIDINLRLRQIAQMKNRGVANYQRPERGSSREPYKEIHSPRSKNLVSLPRSNSNAKLSEYGSITSLRMQPSQYSKQTKGQILLNQKLQTLTMTIQKELKDMK